MAQNQVEEIKSKVDMVELVGEHVDLKNAGRNLRGLCPFHSEKTPSFMVSPELQIFKCFGCGLGGDCFKFVMEFEKVDFPQALKILADRTGVKLERQVGFVGYEEKEELFRINHLALEFYHYLLTQHETGEIPQKYLKERGIEDETIKVFELGIAPDKPDSLFNFLTKKRDVKPELLEKSGLVVRRNNQFYDRFRARLMFPLKDHFGNTAGFSGRILVAQGDVAKYINSPETQIYKKGQMLYGLNITKHDIARNKNAIVVEGEFDLLSPWQRGIKNIVAIKGSSFTEDQARLISRFTNTISLALDSYFAGDQASRRGIDILKKQNLNIKIVSLGENKDPDEFVRKDLEGFKKAVDEAEGVYDFLINSTFQRFDPDTTEGKEKISKELGPLLASIEDEIVKSYCTSLIARRLGVPEQAVASQAAKHSPVKVPNQTTPTKSRSNTKGRRQLLEEKLLVLLLGSPKGVNAEMLSLIETPILAKIAKELESFTKQNENFEIKGFSESLPPELSEQLSILMLTGETEADNLREIVALIETLDQKEEIKEITADIQKEEARGNTEKVDELEQKLSELIKKLAETETN
jgi:DNA primase